eukprot:gb/GEZN01000837.1/.p1 GENE.gb/GEZN01000837.1/~~gb/GEZN01000837.1/.p1  ORF type:complete len:1193 (-),score=175.90 gb/GEZN01000837.1/:48-3596(-)
MSQKEEQLKGEQLKGIPDAFFRRDGFNPFNHWKEDKDNLTEWSVKVEQRVDAIVEQYHKGFGNATSKFSDILGDFTTSQNLLDSLHDNLTEAQRILAVRNLNLKELYFQNMMYDKVLRILDKIDYVKDVPAQVDEFIANKWHLHTVKLLQHTISMLSDDDLREIAALFDLREDLLTKRNAIQERLIEEVHDLLYFKDRHKVKTQERTDDVLRYKSSSSSKSSFGRASSTKIRISRGSASRMQSRAARRSRRSASSDAQALTAGGIGGGVGGGSAPGTKRSSTGPRTSDSSSVTQWSQRISHNGQFSPFKEFYRDEASNADNNSNTGRSRRNLTARNQAPTPREAQRLRIEQLLIQESTRDASRTYGATGGGEPTRNLYLQLILEALDHLNSLPSLQSQIRHRLRKELRAIIQEELKRLLQEQQRSGVTSRSLLLHGGGSGYSFGTATRANKTQAATMLELLRRTFGVMTQVLRLHMEIEALIKERMAEKAAIAAADAPTSVIISKGVSVTVQDGSLGVSDIWSVIEAETQVMLMGFLQAHVVGSIARENSKLKAAAAEVAIDSEALTFSFEDSLVISVAQNSKEKTPSEGKEKNSNNYLARKNLKPQPKSEGESKEEEEEEEEMNSLTQRQGVATITPYNIVIMYRPVIQFTDFCQSILVDSKKEGESRLRQFIGSYIKSSFLPRLEADVNVAIGRILKDPHAFSPREVHRERGAGDLDDSVVLIKSAIEVMQQIRDIFADLLLLPQFMAEFLMLIEHVLNRYLDSCLERYRGATQGKYAASKLTDPKVFTLLQKDPYYLRYRGLYSNSSRGADKKTRAVRMTPAEEALFKQELATTVYQELNRKDFSLRLQQLLSDPAHLADLALVAESLEWLSHEIFALFGSSSSPSGSSSLPSYRLAGAVVNPSSTTGYRLAAAAMPMSGGTEGKRRVAAVTASLLEPTSNRSASYQPAKQKRNLYRTRQRGGDMSGESAPNATSDLMDRKRWELAEASQLLADRCLFALRLEVHCRFYFYLTSVYSSSYHQPYDPTEPEPFVLELNKDLTSMEDALSKYLPGQAMRFLLAGASKFIPDLLIQSLRHIKNRRFNKKGIRKMTRNLFAIQQTLSNLVNTGDQSSFDRARQYYELLLQSEAELNQFRLDNPQLFTAEQYDELLICRRQMGSPTSSSESSSNPKPPRGVSPE